jgi:hypothetical protein
LSQCKADCVGRPARFRFPLDKESELFTQEQIFGRDGNGGPETELYKGQCVEKNAEDSPERMQNRWHGSDSTKPMKSTHIRKERNICGPQAVPSITYDKEYVVGLRGAL